MSNGPGNKSFELNESGRSLEYMMAVNLARSEWQKHPERLGVIHERLGALCREETAVFITDKVLQGSLLHYIARAELYLSQGVTQTDEGFFVGFYDVESTALFMTLALREFDKPQAPVGSVEPTRYITRTFMETPLKGVDNKEQRADGLFSLGCAITEAMFLEFEANGLSTEF